MISFEFMMIVILLVLMFMKKLPQFHSAVNANFGFASALWAIFANQFYQIVRNAENTALYTALSDAGYYPTSRYDVLVVKFTLCLWYAPSFSTQFQHHHCRSFHPHCRQLFGDVWCMLG